MMKSMARNEAQSMASELTAARQVVRKASYKVDVVQRQVGDLQKQVSGLQDRMNRMEILLQRLVNPQARIVELRNMQDLVQSGKLEMEVTRRIEDLGQVNLNSTQGVHLLGTPEVKGPMDVSVENAVTSAAPSKVENVTPSEISLDEFEDLSALSKNDESTFSITVVGASGDLAKKKIFPALFALYYEDCLPKHFTIFGYARSKITDAELRNMVSKTLTCRIDKRENCSEEMEEFLKRCFYHSGQYDSEEHFIELDKKLKQHEGSRVPNRLFYLSIPPNIFLDVVKCASNSASSASGWTRVIVEKPFGRDSESFAALTRGLKQYLVEDIRNEKVVRVWDPGTGRGASNLRTVEEMSGMQELAQSGELVEAPVSTPLDDYKKSVIPIIEEYFSTSEVKLTASDLKELGYDEFHRYFVKRLVSIAMDRHDKEKEMVSVLLSSVYGDVVSSTQIRLGFVMLLEAVDDLAVDILDAVDVLALFIARIVVDDILPPAFLSKAKGSLSKSSKGMQVVQIADKSYLSAPHYAELLELRWGGSTHLTVEEIKRRIADLLKKYIKNGDTAEACRCVREWAMPFFHHEVVQRALTLGMESPAAETLIIKLLKEASEECLISSSQMMMGFSRVAESLDDLSLDIPSAKSQFQTLVSKAVFEGWLDSLYEPSGANGDVQDDEHDKLRSLQELGFSEYNPNFIKKLITLAMDRKNRDKEMASVLLSSLSMELFYTEDIVKGFIMLLESAEDTALNILDASDELGLFLAVAKRSVESAQPKKIRLIMMPLRQILSSSHNIALSSSCLSTWHYLPYKLGDLINHLSILEVVFVLVLKINFSTGLDNANKPLWSFCINLFHDFISIKFRHMASSGEYLCVPLNQNLLSQSCMHLKTLLDAQHIKWLSWDVTSFDFQLEILGSIVNHELLQNMTHEMTVVVMDSATPIVRLILQGVRVNCKAKFTLNNIQICITKACQFVKKVLLDLIGKQNSDSCAVLVQFSLQFMKVTAEELDHSLLASGKYEIGLDIEHIKEMQYAECSPKISYPEIRPLSYMMMVSLAVYMTAVSLSIVAQFTEEIHLEICLKDLLKKLLGGC